MSARFYLGRAPVRAPFLRASAECARLGPVRSACFDSTANEPGRRASERASERASQRSRQRGAHFDESGASSGKSPASAWPHQRRRAASASGQTNEPTSERASERTNGQRPTRPYTQRATCGQLGASERAFVSTRRPPARPASRKPRPVAKSINVQAAQWIGRRALEPFSQERLRSGVGGGGEADGFCRRPTPALDGRRPGGRSALVCIRTQTRPAGVACALVCNERRALCARPSAQARAASIGAVPTHCLGLAAAAAAAQANRALGCFLPRRRPLAGCVSVRALLGSLVRIQLAYFHLLLFLRKSNESLAAHSTPSLSPSPPPPPPCPIIETTPTTTRRRLSASRRASAQASERASKQASRPLSNESQPKEINRCLADRTEFNKATRELN